MDCPHAPPQDFEPVRPFTIAIVGGGIGGVALALSLHAQKVPFHIYEATASFGEIGAGVTFGPNVIRAIHGISPSMLRAYAKHMTTNETPDLLGSFLTFRDGRLAPGAGDDDDGHGVPERLFDVVGPVQEIDGMRFPARCSVHRAHLLDELVRLLPAGSASFGKALVGLREADEADGGEVELLFADGSTASASAVVGCDGIRSVVRTHLHGAGAAAVYAGSFGYRAMAPRAAYERVLGRALAAAGTAFVCPDGYAVAYPVDRGAAVNMLATCARPGRPWRGEGEGEWRAPAGDGELARDLAGWHPGLRALLGGHGGGERWAMFHSPHDRPYCRRRVCLLGDAAHATTPHLGAGAGLAIEDAFLLGRLLGAVGRAADIPRAFRAYDGARRPRTQEIVRESTNNVSVFMAASEARGEALDRLRAESQAKFGLVFDVDLDQSLSDAMSMLVSGTDDGLGGE